jgi:hypothetical protein
MADAEAEDEAIGMLTRHPGNVGCEFGGGLRPDADDSGGHDEAVACLEQMGDQLQTRTRPAQPECRDTECFELPGKLGCLLAAIVGDEPRGDPEPDPAQLGEHAFSFRPAGSGEHANWQGEHSQKWASSSPASADLEEGCGSL